MSVPPSSYRPPSPRRTRLWFFCLSGLAAAAILYAGRPVILPFLLALVVAYVLFPVVLRVERTGIPRWVAVLMVYVLTIGTGSLFTALIAPRLVAETKNLSAELPKLTVKLRDQWLPEIDVRLRRWIGDGAKDGEAGDDDEASDATPLKPPAAIVVRPRSDGGFDIEVNRPMEVTPHGQGYTIEPAPAIETTDRFSAVKVAKMALEKGMEYMRGNTVQLLRLGQRLVSAVSRGIFYFSLTLMLAAYIMVTYEDILGFFRSLWSEDRRPLLDLFLKRLDKALSGVVRGQLLICLVNGVLSAIGFYLFGLKYWPILSLVAGAMSIIPIFGSILSTIPAVAIGLTQSVTIAVEVLVWIIGIHQLEANFLNPKIIGDQAKIHPVLVVFALLLGEHYYRIPGALLAVPCLAIVQAIFMHFREQVLGIAASTGLVAATAAGPTEPAAETEPDDRGPMSENSKASATDTGETLKSAGNYGDDDSPLSNEDGTSG